MVLRGGKQKTFGTNPISYSIPYHPRSITADFSTSRVSRSTLLDYYSRKQSIPIGWAVDEEGNDTTSSERALAGGIKTMDGDIKGALLSLLFSILAGNLLGGVSNYKVKGTRYMDEKPNKGDFFLAFDIEKFSSLHQFQLSIQELVEFISAQDCDFRIPGERVCATKLYEVNEIDVTHEIFNLFNSYNLLRGLHERTATN